MEKFQNLLRGFGNFMVGMPSKEEVDEIRKNNPQMDIFKSDTQLEKEGKVRNNEGNILDSTTGVITKTGNRQGTFSFQDYLNDVGNKMKVSFSGDGEEKTTEVPERDYSKENLELLEKIGDISQEARNREFLREGIRSLANAPLIGAQAALTAAEGINRLTIGNMGAMAAQNSVLAANPTKQKIAGKYFR